MAAMAVMFQPTREVLDKITDWVSLLAHIGMKDPAASALLKALDIGPEDNFAVLADAPQEAITADLKDWEWKDGEQVIKPKAKHLGQMGLVLRYARLLSGKERSDNDPVVQRLPPTPPTLPMPLAPTADDGAASEDDEPVVTAVLTDKADAPDKTAIIMNDGSGGKDGSVTQGNKEETGSKRLLSDSTSFGPAKVLKAGRGKFHKLGTGKMQVFKMSETINQTLNTEVELMPAAQKQAAFDRWVELNGNDPPADIEPSWEQLTGLQLLFDSLEPLFVDFAVWGNRAYRALRKPKMRGLRPVGDGTWTPVEMTGPADFYTWLSCYMVFRTACIMLDLVTPSALDDYKNQIAHWHSLYGQKCWHVIAHADYLARDSYWERSRRACARRHRAARKNTDFDENNPWTHALYDLLANQSFWNDHLLVPCSLVAVYTAAHTRVSHPSLSLDVIDVVPTSVPSLPASSDAGGADLSSKDSDGHYITNKKGVRLCPGFRCGTCLRTNGGRCAADPNMSHQCSICLRNDHGGDGHGKKPMPKAPGGGRNGPPAPPKPPGGGRPRGRGRGRGRA